MMMAGRHGPHDPDADREDFSRPAPEFDHADIRAFAERTAKLLLSTVELQFYNRFGIGYDFRGGEFGLETINEMIRDCCGDVVERNRMGKDLS
jgi:hypothetical protein